MSARTLIKICGLSTADAVDAVIGAGATHAGFIFFEKSPRHVSLDTAVALAERARAGGLLPVAVTVDADDAFLGEIAARMKPAFIQLHGRETPVRAAAVKALSGLPVMKALSIGDAGDLGRHAPYAGISDLFLFDAKPPKDAVLPGGNAASFDWSLLSGFDPGVPWFLAGGLTPANAAGALAIADPTGLDLSSGVESAPGVKDPARIAAFAAAVRAAA
jgi:phosphoribosylanthranilate isomerase